MKIKHANAGILTNYEVLELLRSRGASKDSSRVMASLSTSELKVYDYLVETAACNQTRDNIKEYFEKCKAYDLAQAEKLNVLNNRPDSLILMDPIIEQSDERFPDGLQDFVDMVVQVLPPPPKQQKPDEEADENMAAEMDDVDKGKCDVDKSDDTAEKMEVD